MRAPDARRKLDVSEGRHAADVREVGMRLKKIAMALAILGLGGAAFAQELSDKELKVIGEGRGLFLQQCAGCHDSGAPAAEPSNGDPAPVTNLRRIAARDGRFDKLHVVNHVRFGTQSYHRSRPAAGEMPSWMRLRLSDRAKAECEFHKIVRYLEFAQVR